MVYVDVITIPRPNLIADSAKTVEQRSPLFDTPAITIVEHLRITWVR